MAPGCWFILFLWVWVWWLPLVLVPADGQQQGGDCPAKARCNNLTISRPFWLLDLVTGRSCGAPEFQVTCYNNTPVLRSFGIFGFKIMNMNYENRSLLAIDLGKLELLNAPNSCYPSWNTSVKLGRPFVISNTNKNLIMYNCTEPAAAARRNTELVETRMRCRNESEVFFSAGGRYNETSDNGGYSIEGCDACGVPVRGSSPSGEVNASDYEQLIRGGFLFTWEDPPPLPAAAGSKRTFKKIMLIGSTSSAATSSILEEGL